VRIVTLTHLALDGGTDEVGAATIVVLGLVLFAMVSFDRWRQHRRNRS